MIVVRTRVVGTRIDIYSVWEPSAVIGQHAVITSAKSGGWLGRVGTRALPAGLATQAQSPERAKTVRAWFAQEYEEAYAAILAACPQVAFGNRRGGEIEVTACSEDSA